MGTWMIYGANGYTGELCARESKVRGTSPILAGRREEVIRTLGDELGFETRCFGLKSVDEVADQLGNVDAVLHCAGPFSATAKPMLEACRRTGTHYLDITGEIDVFEFVHQNGDQWRDAGMVALPGVGFDVVPTDCLAGMLKRELPDATHLEMAFKSESAKMSPGTTKTTIEGLPRGGRIRRNGAIERVPAGSLTMNVPFADGLIPAVAIPWGDVSTAYHATGIPNITVYLGAPPKLARQIRMAGRLGWLLGLGPVQSFLKRNVERNVTGPTAKERAADQTQLWGRVRNDAGDACEMTMQTPEGYTLTMDASLRAVEGVLTGNLEPGAYTPSMAFGPDFVLECDGVAVQGVG